MSTLDIVNTIINRVDTSSRPSSQSQGVINAKNCKRMVKKGRFSDGIKALESNGIGKPCPELTQMLEDKHPVSPLPEYTFHPDPQHPSIVLTKETFEKAIASFKTDSAGGPSCLLINHIIDIYRGPQGARIMNAMIRFGNLSMCGAIPVNLSCLYTTATLVPIAKSTSGIRPIAIGETWRRLLCKQASFIVKDKVIAHLSPHQLGVGVRGGAEAIVHATASLFEKYEDREDVSFFQVDFKNAFNSVNRDAIFREVAIHFPELSAWVQFCYADRAWLFTGNDTIFSTTGVQQGDPLGPLLFSLALQPLVLKIKVDVPDLLCNLWYLDDGMVMGKLVEIRLVADLIQDLGADLGLFLTEEKCVVFWKEEQVGWVTLPEAFKRSTTGVTILGSHYGTDAFVDYQARNKVESLSALLDLVKDFDDPQIELLLLRSCTGFPRIVHLLRTCPPHLIMDAVRLFDEAIDASLKSISGFKIEGNIRVLASLPASRAGIAIPVCTEQAHGAFASSVFGTWNLQLQIGVTTPRKHAIESYRTFPGYILDDNADYSTFQLSQHDFKAAHDTIAYNSLLELDDRTRALLYSRSMKHASAFLFAIPSEYNGQNFPRKSFQCALLYVLGHPFILEDGICPECKDLVNDEQGDHALSCASSGQRIGRHNMLIKVITKKLHEAKIDIRHEIQYDADRMGDIELTYWGGTRSLLLDVSVVNPLATSYLGNSSKSIGSSIEARDTEKRTKYAAQIEDGAWFQPLSMETFGGWGKSSIMLFKDITAQVANQNFTDARTEMKRFMTSLSCALQIHNGEMLFSRMHTH